VKQSWPQAGGQLGDGPWASAFWFSLDGPVQSKSNYRQDARTRARWATHAGYELRVHTSAVKALPPGWDPGRRDQALADRPRMAVFCYATSLLDTGNVNKSIMDALQGRVMVNDNQVAAALEVGTRDRLGQGVLVAVAALAPGTSPSGAALAAAALAAGALDAFAAAGGR